MRIPTRLATVFVAVVLSQVAHAAPNTAHRSDFRRVEGLKFPNSSEEGSRPVPFAARVADVRALGGYNELLPYVLRSPDQEDAGSCLYMATTGIVEMSLARLHPNVSRLPDGPLDLSERWLMNKGAESGASAVVDNFLTDTIYLFNTSSRTVRNSAYRFTKGWYYQQADGDIVRAPDFSDDAEYGTGINWLDERDQIAGGAVTLPKFGRTVLYKDPTGNKWAVGGMPRDIVSRVKTALRTKKAPVLVVYNHFGYWHAVYIAGYDDEADSDDCRFVRETYKYFAERADTRGTAEDIKAAWERGGGCAGKGVFYVRDSIYPDDDGPSYDFDPDHSGDEAPYSQKVVLHEYEWLEYLANHAVQIYVRD
jgi:hypothetical protein